MRILIATDAWYPQVNGVVRTTAAVIECLEAEGHQILVLSPDQFRSMPCPTYHEIRLALARQRRVGRLIRAFSPQAVHISTEGPVGFAVRRYCLKHNLPFTTSFHTKFPEYIQARFRVPVSAGYAAMRWFHKPAERVMFATDSLRQELAARGFQNLALWSRGVDTEQFRPRTGKILDGAPPFSMFVGRVAVEKNIEDFLKLDIPGTKYVVGDGPKLRELKAKYPAVRFTGYKTGEALADYLAAADVFVFPSRTDTFGLVMLEALASGVPVAAYPVTGPVDVIDGSGAGALDDDLGKAVQRALSIDPGICRAHALKYSWRQCAQQFLVNLVPFG